MQLLQGYKLGIHHSKNVDSELRGPHLPCMEQAYSPQTMSGTPRASYSSPSAVDWSGHSISSEIEESVPLADPEISSLVKLFQLPPDPSFHSDGTTGAGKNCLLLLDYRFLSISVHLIDYIFFLLSVSSMYISRRFLVWYDEYSSLYSLLI